MSVRTKWSSGNLVFYNKAAVGAVQVGEFSSVTAGSGIALSASRTSAFRVYADDGAAALTAGAYRAGVARMLLKTACAAGDISVYGWQSQLKIAADYSLATGILGGLWGYVEMVSGAKVNVGGAVVAHIDVPSGATISGRLAGLLVKTLDLGGTHTGVATMLALETPGAGTFDYFLTLGTATGVTTGTTGATAAGCLKVLDGATPKYVQLFSGVS